MCGNDYQFCYMFFVFIRTMFEDGCDKPHGNEEDEYYPLPSVVGLVPVYGQLQPKSQDDIMWSRQLQVGINY